MTQVEFNNDIAILHNLICEIGANFDSFNRLVEDFMGVDVPGSHEQLVGIAHAFCARQAYLRFVEPELALAHTSICEESHDA